MIWMRGNNLRVLSYKWHDLTKLIFFSGDLHLVTVFSLELGLSCVYGDYTVDQGWANV